MVHWVMTIDRRATGWLDELRHARFREALLHTMVRYDLLCPVYCLMPDHVHLVWVGVDQRTDQKQAAAFFRRITNRVLAPEKWQQEPYDNVLREEQRKRGAFQTVCHYVWENPVRAKLSGRAGDHPWSGAVVPGFPDLEPRRDDFWDVFWRIYHERVDGRSAP